ncbi:SUMF1/EgtB/PvdO family nonheme iron enzyme [Sphaerotilus sp.]|uniref:SUMF1/EgtB/PvdO family nonheme iron enzyme n=1 Tax=Sphaerotilus sp. TaxID=2093942 RepID=UPI00286DBD4D|nr:SUMF1/EgtB/PvdO family nonheme iron enzyme [Sphaerotilus sp.]
MSDKQTQAPNPRANLDGCGAIAQGTHAVAVGPAGVYVGGNSSGPITIHHGPDPKAHQRQWLDRYLRDLVQLTDQVALGGAGVALSSLYTALLVHRGDLMDDTAAAETILAMKGEKRRPISALEAMNAEPRLVLLGGPGSGKSTLLDAVALGMAGDVLEDAARHLSWLRMPVPTEKRPGKEQEQAEPQRWDHGVLLPVPVVLRDLVAQRSTDSTGKADGLAVLRYLEQRLKERSLDEFAAVLRDSLDHGHCLVLFDGLDEVPDAEGCREHAKAALEQFAERYPRNRFVVTCRTYAYLKDTRGAWALQGFATAQLLPFTRPQTDRLIEAWYGVQIRLGKIEADTARAHAATLRKAIDGNARLAELAQQPLLLTLMVRLQVRDGGQLPHRREALYDEVVTMLLDEWEGEKCVRDATGREVVRPSLAEWLKTDPACLRRELQRLAFEAHRGQRELRGTADIPRQRLVEALERARPDDDLRPKLLERHLSERLGLLHERTGLLAEHGGEGCFYKFPHRSFQEYLAACHLTDADFPDALAGLACADLNRWREVTLLAAAKVARGSQSSVWELSQALCCKDRDGGDADRHGALLAGQVLAENVDLRDLPERREAHLGLMRDWQLKLLRHPKMPALERALAGRTLAKLGDPRPEVTDVDAMQFCFVPAGAFTMGGETWEDSTKLVHRVDLPSPYFMARFPVTTAQWLAFVNDGNTPDGVNSLEGRPNAPALHVTFRDARRFCAWLTRRWRDRLPPGWEVALPSEAEWEKAARGGERVPVTPQTVEVDAVQVVMCGSQGAMQSNGNGQRVYPWGDDFDAERANGSAVGAFATGASPYGCEDMAGNVWEWTSSLHKKGEPHLVVRGGSWVGSVVSLRGAFHDGVHPDYRFSVLGFRVVLRCSPV